MLTTEHGLVGTIVSQHGRCNPKHDETGLKLSLSVLLWLIFLCLMRMCTCVQVLVKARTAHLDLQELKLQASVSCPVWVLRAELWSLKEQQEFNCWTISPDPSVRIAKVDKNRAWSVSNNTAVSRAYGYPCHLQLPESAQGQVQPHMLKASHIASSFLSSEIKDRNDENEIKIVFVEHLNTALKWFSHANATSSLLSLYNLTDLLCLCRALVIELWTHLFSQRIPTQIGAGEKSFLLLETVLLLEDEIPGILCLWRKKSWDVSFWRSRGISRCGLGKLRFKLLALLYFRSHS